MVGNMYKLTEIKLVMINMWMSVYTFKIITDTELH